MALRLLLLLLCLLTRKASSNSASCSLNVTVEDASPSDCYSPSPLSDNDFICSSLQDALQLVLEKGYNVNLDGPVCISLTPGLHYVAYTAMEIDYSVHIVGSSDCSSTVRCLENAKYNKDEYDEFPLRFGRYSTNVSLENIKFTDCERPLMFDGIASVTVDTCQFSDFTQTALEIYNTPSVTIENSTFRDNLCKGQGTIRNSGNAGAVSIGYNNTYNRSRPQIKIKSCNFFNNTAELVKSSESSNNCSGPNPALSQQIFVERGGGIGCYFSAPGLQSEVDISDCVFEGNRAIDSGGGIYMNLNNNSTTIITIRDSDFTSNKAMHGAGVEITFDTDDSVQHPNQLTLERCHFTDNSAFQGGGVKCPQLNQNGNLNHITINDCQFEGNIATETGAAVHMQTYLTGLLTINAKRIRIDSSSFTNNTGKRGIAFLSFNHAVFTGTNQFTNNTGPALRIRGSLASLKDTVLFQGNSHHPEGLSGALYMSSFSQLLLNPGVNIKFLDNTGQDGAAIVVRTPQISSGFARTLYNPQCFLQFSSSTTPPVNWTAENVSILFSDNKALVGPNIFISNLNACTWFNFSGDYFNLNITQTWSFMEAKDNRVTGRSLKGENARDLYIQTQLQTIEVSPRMNNTCSCPGTDTDVFYNAYAGESISIHVIALDQFSHSTSGFLEFSFSDQSGDGEQFTPSIVHAVAGRSTVNVVYNSNTSARGTLNATIKAAFSSTDISTSFILCHIPCLPGFRHDLEKGSCECDDISDILVCDNQNKNFVLLEDGLWGAPPNWSRSLVTYACPPEYCNCTGSPDDSTIEGCALIYDKPNDICTERRQGVLCGQCKAPYGVGMLDLECKKFAQVNMYLIPLLVLFVSIAVVIIVKLGVVIPHCLLGFLFYIQVSSVAVASFNRPLNLSHDMMKYVNSFLSLYVPYDFSLHSRLSALKAYGLRYISPALALLIAPFAAYIKFHPRSWNGMWTLVLLMYGMAAQTSSSILFCPTFSTTTINNNRKSITVWFYDGSVTCFEGSHLALSHLSIFCLLLLSLLVPTLAIIAYHQELSAKFPVLEHRWLEKLSLSLTSPYHHHTRWWLPLELGRRLIFILSIVYCPGYVSLPLLEAGVLLALTWFTQPYRDRKANASEAFSLGVLVVILSLGSTNALVNLGREKEKVCLFPLFYLPLAVGVVSAVFYAGWKIGTSKTLKMALASMRGRPSTRQSRRLTQALISRKKSVLSTEVSFEEAVDFELSQM